MSQPGSPYQPQWRAEEQLRQQGFSVGNGGEERSECGAGRAEEQQGLSEDQRVRTWSEWKTAAWILCQARSIGACTKGSLCG